MTKPEQESAAFGGDKMPSAAQAPGPVTQWTIWSNVSGEDTFEVKANASGTLTIVCDDSRVSVQLMLSANGKTVSVPPGTNSYVVGAGFAILYYTGNLKGQFYSISYWLS